MYIKLDKELKVTELLPFDNPIVVECGAHNGDTARCFLERFPRIQYFCFEPDPRNILAFRERVNDSRCKLYEAAVADIDGQITFRQSAGTPPGHPEDYVHTFASTIKGIERHKQCHPWVRFKDPIQVKAVKLDTWLVEEGIDSIDFLWADVEGAEEELIKGGIETLKRTHYFYTEFDNNQNFGGRITLPMIQQLIPDFELVEQWPYDALFHNKNWG